MRLPAAMALALYEGAELAARAIARAAAGRSRHQPRVRGRILPPGENTPLWNELIRQVAPHLAKRGSKAKLARVLDVPRQRLQACLKAKKACLDAERTLLLLSWLAARHQGREISG